MCLGRVETARARVRVETARVRARVRGRVRVMVSVGVRARVRVRARVPGAKGRMLSSSFGVCTYASSSVFAMKVMSA